MIITLARIDDRLIHGQVTTVWSKESHADRMIIVDEDVYHDEIRKTLLKQACPPGMKVNIVDAKKAVAVYNNPKYKDVKVFYLFTNPTEALKVIQRGIAIKILNIGGMQYREDRSQITKAISVNAQDIESFRQLNDLGVKLDIQTVKTDPHINLMEKLPAEG
ncbi:mannose/fructose/sorbose PTS transporter subunit IIB [Bombilactobacillus folatiphilus]|uniref:Mannose/fructose/sorbose PTS transporter subunit IIB n=1 Tax=Bombilactobacillus folatiphilus TaxID=2923362 RepID=A0ABY4P6U3_9LACO|nr:mannose/fructose/sorbose PTS transporter subunit IIB [Bombilactobacillus folatiphilus]UQS81454.1 mannose/fructose/sorbose PTS transporter subunit IIB [Bombilactobacillus folatiphilus]